MEIPDEITERMLGRNAFNMFCSFVILWPFEQHQSKPWKKNNRCLFSPSENWNNLFHFFPLNKIQNVFYLWGWTWVRGLPLNRVGWGETAGAADRALELNPAAAHPRGSRGSAAAARGGPAARRGRGRGFRANRPLTPRRGRALSAAAPLLLPKLRPVSPAFYPNFFRLRKRLQKSFLPFLNCAQSKKKKTNLGIVQIFFRCPKTISQFTSCFSLQIISSSKNDPDLCQNSGDWKKFVAYQVTSERIKPKQLVSSIKNCGSCKFKTKCNENSASVTCQSNPTPESNFSPQPAPLSFCRIKNYAACTTFFSEENLSPDRKSSVSGMSLTFMDNFQSSICQSKRFCSCSSFVWQMNWPWSRLRKFQIVSPDARSSKVWTSTISIWKPQLQPLRRMLLKVQKANWSRWRFSSCSSASRLQQRLSEIFALSNLEATTHLTLMTDRFIYVGVFSSTQYPHSFANTNTPQQLQVVRQKVQGCKAGRRGTVQGRRNLNISCLHKTPSSLHKYPLNTEH